MPTNLHTMPAVMASRAREIESSVGRLMRNAFVTMGAAVIVGTPKDTGKATSNWLASLGEAPEHRVVPPHAPGRRGNTAGANNQAAIIAMQSIVSGHRSLVPLNLTNDLHYLDDLNKGTSPQAAPGFIRALATAAFQAFRGERLLR